MTYVERNVVEPKGIVQVHKDYWWWCVEGDPKRALFATWKASDIGSPQCNANEELARVVGTKLGHDQRAKLIQIPMAFVPWEC